MHWGDCVDLKIVEKALISYKEATVSLLNCLNMDEYDNLQKYISERELAIDKLKNLEYSMEDFTNIFISLEIDMLQKQVDALMLIKKEELRLEMNNIAKTKNANKQYKKGVSVDSIYFNKKI